MTSEGNFDFVLRWVSVADFVGSPPTKKEVEASALNLQYIYVSCWKPDEAALRHVSAHHRLNKFEDKEDLEDRTT